MKLRPKILWSTATVLLGLLLTLSGSLAFILLRSFAHLEAQRMEEDVQRVLSALDEEFNNLSKTAKDWSAWDDSYEFMQGQRPQYPQENFYESTLQNLGLNFVVFLDLQGKVILQQSVSTQGLAMNTGDALALNQAQAGRLPEGLTLKAADQWFQEGWLQRDDRLLYFSAQPIVNSSRDRPPLGSLIMGRYLDGDRVKNLADRTKLQLTVYPLQQHQSLDSPLLTLVDNLKNLHTQELQDPTIHSDRPPQPQPILTRPLDSHWIGGYALIWDLQQRPLILLEVKADRQLYRQGQWSLVGLLAASGVAVAMFSGVMVVTLDRLLIDRLLELIKTVTTITHSQDLSRRMTITGRDELTLLSQEINAMLGKLEGKEQELLLEKAKSENLLANILPDSVVQQLKQDNKIVACYFPDVTILFADIVGFTQLSTRITPEKLVQLLNQIFSQFDRLAQQYGLEKIKTIGDAYMVVGGAPLSMVNHAHAIAQVALDMQQMIRSFQVDGIPDGVHTFQMRIGINTGPVVAGVIGLSKFAYDIWGDAVNLASRMESSGEPGQIQVTESTYELLKDDFILEPRGRIFVKGKGEMVTYWLHDRQGKRENHALFPRES